MKVHKFGGASVKDAEGIRSVAEIISQLNKEDSIFVLSAMGKTTNSLEIIAKEHFNKTGKAAAELESLKKFHEQVLNELFPEKHSVFTDINNLFVELEWALEDEPREDFGFEYDQIVAVGELLSTKILAAYLNLEKESVTWLDARDLIKTDNTHRNARVDWELTKSCVQAQITSAKAKGKGAVLTQGFIGCTSENFSTTLGREGSDYTAAILAYAIDASEVNVWKDVPGMLNADPRFFENAELINKLSFREAIELAYYGAKVIHPKTIQPLQKKNIPLRVRSFKDMRSQGSLIAEGLEQEPKVPFYILKQNQTLLSISSRDFAFIVEDHLKEIFSVLAKYQISSNLMQNSAISFSICFDAKVMNFDKVLDELGEQFDVRFNEGLDLYTLRHYSEAAEKELLKGKDLILEQKSRHTLQVLVK